MGDLLTSSFINKNMINAGGTIGISVSCCYFTDQQINRFGPDIKTSFICLFINLFTFAF